MELSNTVNTDLLGLWILPPVKTIWNIFLCKKIFVSSDPACTDVLGVDFRPGFAS